MKKKRRSWLPLIIVVLIVGSLVNAFGSSKNDQKKQSLMPTPSTYVTVAPMSTTEPKPKTAMSGSLSTNTTSPLAQSVTTSPFFPTLQLGEKSDDVLKLQMRLIELGFSIGEADGNYGTKTESAIKAVQIEAGLYVTGIADNETQTIIWSKVAPTSLPLQTTKPKPTPEPQYASDEYTEEYVLNKNTKKFHYAWCSSVGQMKDKNKLEFNGTRDEVIRKGYAPCKRCDP